MSLSKRISVKSIAVTAIMGAVGFVLMMLEFPIPFLIPGFIKFDFSELPAIITAFALGPIQGIAVCLIKNLLHLFVTTTGGVGELSNFLLGAIFVGIAGVIYRFKKTRGGAFIGALAGALTMALISIVTNYFITYPFYAQVFFPTAGMEGIISLYKGLIPASDTLLKCLIIFNLPFNFAKGMIDALIAADTAEKLKSSESDN